MRKLVAAINMTVDGFCDHTAGIADDELHQHYADLLKDAGVILYGRVTFQLMEYWRSVIVNPTGNPATDEFARVIDRIPKIVFSRTLDKLEWETAELASQDIGEVVHALKRQSGNDILVGSPSLIVTLTQLGLIDEYQLCIHPVIIGTGLPLFRDITGKIMLRLQKTRTFSSGAIILYYEPLRH